VEQLMELLCTGSVVLEEDGQGQQLRDLLRLLQMDVVRWEDISKYPPRNHGYSPSPLKLNYFYFIRKFVFLLLIVWLGHFYWRQSLTRTFLYILIFLVKF
jgi:hypothetical protein